MDTLEDLHAQLQAVVDAAAGRTLTDDEVAAYEALETRMDAVRKTEQIRARQTAYNTPTAPAGWVAPAKPDNGLDMAFEAYLRTGQPNADITGLAIVNSQGVGTSAGGGYTVPSGFRQKLIEVMASFGGFAPHTEELNTSDGAPIEWPTLDDTANSGAIVAESATPSTGADLTFGNVSLGAYDYTSQGASGSPLRVPWALLQDSAFDIPSLVARKLGERIARAQAPHWVTGTGAGQPKGIVAAGLTSDRDLDTADTPDYEDLVDLTDLLDEAYEPNAKWLMKKNTWSQLRLIVDTAGRPIVQDSTAGIAEAPARRLLGHPVIIDEAMPTLSSAADTYCIAYGDFREAYIRRMVASIAVVVNPYSRANQRETEFTAWQRADGNIQNRSAYVILQNNT